MIIGGRERISKGPNLIEIRQVKPKWRRVICNQTRYWGVFASQQVKIEVVVFNLAMPCPGGCADERRGRGVPAGRGCARRGFGRRPPGAGIERRAAGCAGSRAACQSAGPRSATPRSAAHRFGAPEA